MRQTDTNTQAPLHAKIMGYSYERRSNGETTKCVLPSSIARPLQASISCPFSFHPSLVRLYPGLCHSRLDPQSFYERPLYQARARLLVIWTKKAKSILANHLPFWRDILLFDGCTPKLLISDTLLKEGRREGKRQAHSFFFAFSHC